MSYELRREESLGDSLRRVCRKQIEAAMAIAQGEKETEDTPVHETRKHLKKARAALRLVREEIGRGLFRRQDHCLRDVGRIISEVRDAEVRLQTVRQLQGVSQKRGRAIYSSLEAMLVLELENFMAAFAEWQTQAVPMLARVLEMMDHWTLDGFGAGELRWAVQWSYKRARHALAEARARPSVETFHELRREAKILWCQLRILRPVNQVVLKTVTDELEAVGDLLGRAHDLSFLGQRLDMERGQADWQKEGQELLAVIEVSQADLQRGAAELAERFFSERPRDFGDRVAAWLEEWAGAGPRSLTDAFMEERSSPPVRRPGAVTLVEAPRPSRRKRARSK
jgi:CHAD domain-containing protein